MCKASAEKAKEISFAEVKSHNTPKSAWAVVNKQVIDITNFAKRHPGGDIILLAAGKDATVLYHTYHPNGIPQALLDKLQIGTLPDSDVPDSYYDWSSPFYDTLCKRVVERLKSLNRPLRGNSDIQIKAVAILLCFWGSLYKMYTSEFHQAIVWSIIMGVFAHFVGTCIQHDGNHGAFSKMPFINTVAGWTMDMIGVSWKVSFFCFIVFLFHLNLLFRFVHGLIIFAKSMYTGFCIYMAISTYAWTSSIHKSS